AVMLSDLQADGLSAVYSFFRQDCADRGLGTFMILDLVRRARARGRPYVYLGYWIAESRKMAYKTRYKPCEVFRDGRWQEYIGA
ncbi:MAG: arginyltransferase, partial [Pseudomonadota bacterium]|nr:arginyltransferase [Pseudomonadota bacterium]